MCVELSEMDSEASASEKSLDASMSQVSMLAICPHPRFPASVITFYENSHAFLRPLSVHVQSILTTD